MSKPGRGTHTPLSLHLLAWRDCRECHYSETRRKIVLGRGDVPCDVLFIGEGPGPSEDMLGLPFIGKSGKLLDRIVRRVFGPPDKMRYRVAFNNIVACIPIESGHQKEEPDAECVLACRPRLEEFIKIAEPRLIIAVGQEAAGWLDQAFKNCIQLPGRIPVVEIEHPGSMIRKPESAQRMAEHAASVIISTAVIQYLETT